MAIQMNVCSNNQLIPYSPGSRHLQPYTRLPSIPLANHRNRAAMRYTLINSLQSPGHTNHRDEHESIYSSSHRIKSHNTRMVGLLIDIYA